MCINFLGLSPTQPLGNTSSHSQMRKVGKQMQNWIGKKASREQRPTHRLFDEEHRWKHGKSPHFSTAPTPSWETFKQGFRFSHLLNADSTPFYLKVTVKQNKHVIITPVFSFLFMQVKQKPLGPLSGFTDNKTLINPGGIKSHMWSHF